MNRQLFFRVLLSFVLLFSQQMATAHALEHLTAAIGIVNAASPELDDASELAKAVAQHQNCHQCLAFAQLAGPLASSACSVAPLELIAYGSLQATDPCIADGALLAAQPRGPPRT